MQSEITIERIPARELYQFARRTMQDREHYPVLPIDPVRAKAQALNPAASDDSVGLLVAYNRAGRCIGYVGMLPCRAFVDGSLVPVLAPTTQFVHPDYRRKPPPGGMTVADMIYAEVLKTGLDLLITGFNEAGDRIYRRNPQWFTPLEPLTFLRIKLSKLQPTSTIMRRLAYHPRMRTLRPLFKGGYHLSQRTVDILLEPFVYRALRSRSTPPIGELAWRTVDRVKPPDVEDPSPSPGDIVYFHRGVDVINWMIANPWYSSRGSAADDYYFDQPREAFFFRAYECYHRNTDQRLGYAVLSFSKERGYTTMKVLDRHLAVEEPERFVFDLALREALRLNVNVIECSEDFLPIINAKKTLRALTDRFERPYYLAFAPDSPLKRAMDRIHLDYCDGERPFG